VLSNGGEKEHAGRQTSAGSSLPLVRRSPGGENTVLSGTRARVPPLIRDLKQPADMPETEPTVRMCAQLVYVLVRPKFFFSFFAEPLTFIVVGGFSVQL
jgi:hypothetical protein